MKAAQVRELTHDELRNRIRETTKELFEARIEAATGQLGHTHKVKMLRRRRARFLTVLREWELGIERTEGGEAAS